MEMSMRRIHIIRVILGSIVVGLLYGAATYLPETYHFLAGVAATLIALAIVIRIGSDRRR